MTEKTVRITETSPPSETALRPEELRRSGSNLHLIVETPGAEPKGYLLRRSSSRVGLPGLASDSSTNSLRRGSITSLGGAGRRPSMYDIVKAATRSPDIMRRSPDSPSTDISFSFMSAGDYAEEDLENPQIKSDLEKFAREFQLHELSTKRLVKQTLPPQDTRTEAVEYMVSGFREIYDKVWNLCSEKDKMATMYQRLLDRERDRSDRIRKEERWEREMLMKAHETEQSYYQLFVDRLKEIHSSQKFAEESTKESIQKSTAEIDFLKKTKRELDIQVSSLRKQLEHERVLLLEEQNRSAALEVALISERRSRSVAIDPLINNHERLLSAARALFPTPSPASSSVQISHAPNSMSDSAARLFSEQMPEAIAVVEEDDETTDLFGASNEDDFAWLVAPVIPRARAFRQPAKGETEASVLDPHCRFAALVGAIGKGKDKPAPGTMNATISFILMIYALKIESDTEDAKYGIESGSLADFVWEHLLSKQGSRLNAQRAVFSLIGSINKFGRNSVLISQFAQFLEDTYDKKTLDFYVSVLAALSSVPEGLHPSSAESGVLYVDTAKVTVEMRSVFRALPSKALNRIALMILKESKPMTEKDTAELGPLKSDKEQKISLGNALDIFMEARDEAKVHAVTLLRKTCADYDTGKHKLMSEKDTLTMFTDLDPAAPPKLIKRLYARAQASAKSGKEGVPYALLAATADTAGLLDYGINQPRCPRLPPPEPVDPYKPIPALSSKKETPITEVISLLASDWTTARGIAMDTSQRLHSQHDMFGERKIKQVLSDTEASFAAVDPTQAAMSLLRVMSVLVQYRGALAVKATPLQFVKDFVPVLNSMVTLCLRLSASFNEPLLKTPGKSATDSRSQSPLKSVASSQLGSRSPSKLSVVRTS